jgi:hypothetical protein
MSKGSKHSIDSVTSRVSGFFKKTPSLERRLDRRQSASSALGFNKHASEKSMDRGKPRQRSNSDLYDVVSAPRAPQSPKSQRAPQVSVQPQIQEHGIAKSKLPLSQLSVGMSLRVNKSYVAENTTELDISEGDVIELASLPMFEQVFWVGICRTWDERNGNEGLFPSSHVEVSSRTFILCSSKNGPTQMQMR